MDGFIATATAGYRDRDLDPETRSTLVVPAARDHPSDGHSWWFESRLPGGGFVLEVRDIAADERDGAPVRTKVNAPCFGTIVIDGTLFPVLTGSAGGWSLYGSPGSAAFRFPDSLDPRDEVRADHVPFTPRADSWTGPARSDNADGPAGNDLLRGGRGNGTPIGSMGRNSVSGDEHDDHLLGGGNRDEIQGGRGRDVIHGGAAGDRPCGRSAGNLPWGDPVSAGGTGTRSTCRRSTATGTRRAGRRCASSRDGHDLRGWGEVRPDTNGG